MIFNIIPSEQTPKVLQNIVVNADYLEKNREKFKAFLKFAKQQQNAVGLAANQCSLNGVRFNEYLFAHKNIKTGEWSLIIAPKITEYVGMCEQKIEGCLTWVGRVVVADRFRALNVEYYDMDGNFYMESIKGFDAQIWQHEVNHLNGIPEDIQDISFQLPKQKEVGRNEKCPCGSGRKYKQCCLLLK